MQSPRSGSAWLWLRPWLWSCCLLLDAFSHPAMTVTYGACLPLDHSFWFFKLSRQKSRQVHRYLFVCNLHNLPMMTLLWLQCDCHQSPSWRRRCHTVTVTHHCAAWAGRGRASSHNATSSHLLSLEMLSMKWDGQFILINTHDWVSFPKSEVHIYQMKEK